MKEQQFTHSSDVYSLRKLQSAQHRLTLWFGALRSKHNPEGELFLQSHFPKTCSLRRVCKRRWFSKLFHTKMNVKVIRVFYTQVHVVVYMIWRRVSGTVKQNKSKQMADYKNPNLASVATKRGESATPMKSAGAPRSAVHTHMLLKTQVDLWLVWKEAFVEAVHLISSLW